MILVLEEVERFIYRLVVILLKLLKRQIHFLGVGEPDLHQCYDAIVDDANKFVFHRVADFLSPLFLNAAYPLRLDENLIRDG